MDSRSWGWGLLLALAAMAAAALFLFRAPPSAELGIEYVRAGDRPLRLDVYRPAVSLGSRPAVLLIHGGGWVQGDRSEQRSTGEQLARAGFVAIAVGYRLAADDASRHPAQVDDVRRAVRWVRANAGRLGVDPLRVGAYGISAGGHLAAMLGTTEALDEDPAQSGRSSRVACVVDFCGPTDFTDPSRPPFAPRSLWMADNLFGRPYTEDTQACLDASPLAHVDSRSAPTLILHGEADEIVPVDQSRRFRDALVAAGVEARLVELAGEGHAILRPETRARLDREVMAFLRRHLKP